MAPHILMLRDEYSSSALFTLNRDLHFFSFGFIVSQQSGQK
jgi:hypothetical protein